ncbi:hypothetical protein DEO72_LG8g1788 [Vigna unguiculata]|uniref:GRF-type domain-containing protein n=1 Tax=Vigna unguiculata TaxID=3917 RepID=A0A4D6MT06_VIGUN|nr:hypothetical protein DEO72_LG8g1788 [Vigna unguiculata]
MTHSHTVFQLRIACNGWCCCWYVQNTTVTGMAVAVTVKLPQASTSRPGEVTRGSPRPSRANGRLGDSLNFEQAEEDSPERETLTWARLLSLSNGLSEKAFSLGFSCLLVAELYSIVLLCDGETFRVALQWSGRNSMAPVSGCPWWCPICMTRAMAYVLPYVLLLYSPVRLLSCSFGIVSSDVASQNGYVSMKIIVQWQLVVAGKLICCKATVSGSVGGTPHCHCGEIVVLRVARTVKNGGKQFWGCPHYKRTGSEDFKGCNYFKWCTEENGDERDATIAR